MTVSTNLGPWVNRRGVFDRHTRNDVFRDANLASVQRWGMAPTGQHIELGIAGGGDAAMQRHLRREKAVDRARLASEGDMAFVALDADEAYIEGAMARGGAGVVHPASPTAAKLDHGEAAACQIDSPECGAPLGDVGVPVGRDGDRLDLSRAFGEDGREEFRVDDDAEEIRQATRAWEQAGNSGTTNDRLRVEAGVVMEKGARCSACRRFARGQPGQQRLPLV